MTANVVARVISAGFNFFLSKKFVFASDKPFLKRTRRLYFTRQLLINAEHIDFNGPQLRFGIGPLVGKIITEIGMFFFNWFCTEESHFWTRERCALCQITKRKITQKNLNDRLYGSPHRGFGNGRRRYALHLKEPGKVQ